MCSISCYLTANLPKSDRNNKNTDKDIYNTAANKEEIHWHNSPSFKTIQLLMSYQQSILHIYLLFILLHYYKEACVTKEIIIFKNARSYASILGLRKKP